MLAFSDEDSSADDSGVVFTKFTHMQPSPNYSSGDHYSSSYKYILSSCFKKTRNKIERRLGFGWKGGLGIETDLRIQFNFNSHTIFIHLEIFQVHDNFIFKICE